MNLSILALCALSWAAKPADTGTPPEDTGASDTGESSDTDPATPPEETDTPSEPEPTPTDSDTTGQTSALATAAGLAGENGGFGCSNLGSSMPWAALALAPVLVVRRRRD